MNIHGDNMWIVGVIIVIILVVLVLHSAKQDWENNERDGG